MDVMDGSEVIVPETTSVWEPSDPGPVVRKVATDNYYHSFLPLTPNIWDTLKMVSGKVSPYIGCQREKANIL